MSRNVFPRRFSICKNCEIESRALRSAVSSMPARYDCQFLPNENIIKKSTHHHATIMQKISKRELGFKGKLKCVMRFLIVSVVAIEQTKSEVVSRQYAGMFLDLREIFLNHSKPSRNTSIEIGSNPRCVVFHINTHQRNIKPETSIALGSPYNKVELLMTW